MKIAVLGCGWLGLPLAKELVYKGFEVRGSTTRKEKMNELEKVGIEPYLLSLSGQTTQQELQNFLEGIDILVFNTPPLSNSEEEVATCYQTLLKVAEKNISKLLLVSSTGIFEETADFKVYTENTSINPTNKRSKNLYAIERFFSANKNFETTLVRLGGLYGNQRHPAHYISRKSEIDNPLAPINLTSLDLAVQKLSIIIEKGFWNITFHILENNYSSRIQYYTDKCNELGITTPPPSDQPSKGKFVGSLNSYLLK